MNPAVRKHSRRTVAFVVCLGACISQQTLRADSKSATAPLTVKSETVARSTEKPLVPPVTQRFASLTSETPSFRRHVVPLLGKLGCNGRACHGSFQGRGGFRLSLFGYDFKMDHDSLLAGDEPRANPKNPDASLILQKPTLRIPHEGGQRYKLGGWEHHILLRWIEAGAAGVAPNEPNLARLEVFPKEIKFAKSGDQVALKVVAYWTDGSSEDVTPLCRFQTNDEHVAKIDVSGRVSSVAAGDSHVVAFYDSGVAPIPVLRPVSEVIGDRYPKVETPTEIDRLVVRKLRKLGIVPSELCTDAEFLRRVSLDLTGTLPPAEEVAAFLADKSAEKRRRKIDELLQRPTYAAWWTTRLCDITGNNDRAVANITPVGQSASQEWYDWILKRVTANVPYDKLVEGIVLSSSRRHGQSYTDYAKELSDLYRKGSKERYADRPGLTHFWARRTLGQPQQKALAFAYTFLGIRIQCAECHKHPFDQWTQQDYRDFTKFFTRVRYGIDPRDQSQYSTLLASLGVDAKRRNDLRNMYPKFLAEGKTLPLDELFVIPAQLRNPVRAQRPRPQRVEKKIAAKNQPAQEQKKSTMRPEDRNQLTKAERKQQGRKPAGNLGSAAAKKIAANTKASNTSATNPSPKGRTPVVARRPKGKAGVAAKARRPAGPGPQNLARLLGGDVVDLSKFDDPRVPLLNWLRSSKNRFFARAFVNRVWASYFNVGIVDPPDALSLANPPSNAELLDYLANGFAKHGYDMKWLHREILNSRTYQLSWRPNDTNRLDERNFSHAVMRRLPAEVAFDAVRQATASDKEVHSMETDCRDRAIGIPGTVQRRRFGSQYALSVFGKSVRESNCDCDRSNEPSLLQTVFLRNDDEVLGLVNDARTGWIAQLATELQPKKVTRAVKSPTAATLTKRSKESAGKRLDKSASSARKPIVAPRPVPRSGPALADSSAASSSRSEQTKKRIKGNDASKKVGGKSSPKDERTRRIAELTERLKQLRADGKVGQAHRVAARLEQLKRSSSRVTPTRTAQPLALPQVKLTSARKSELIRTAYLRTLSRYPDEHEAARSMRYLDDSQNVLSGLRDLVWALVNTQEFIVNH